MDTKKIGAFIAQNRKAKGLTQEQLGQRLGVSNKTVSRWENGNYMPDLSLLEPLSRELGITLNELLAGETLQVEETIAYSEKNIINALDYSVDKIRKEHNKISVLMMVVGIVLCFCAFIIIEPESSWSSIYSIVGLILFVSGVFRGLPIVEMRKRLLISLGLFLLMVAVFFVIDFIGVSTSKRPPIYRYVTETRFSEDKKAILYKNPFYNVYRINADTLNEYYILDIKKEYTFDTVPLSPFNREKSGIDNILKYHSQFIGDNSNTGGLIESLPLSEYGYVFEIDSQDRGLIIDYHLTDWYENDNLYVHKSMIYNAVSIFGLIENVQYIDFNFSGSHYHVTRDVFEQTYPSWKSVVHETRIDRNNFNRYVEEKIDDTEFVEAVFSLFEASK